MNPYLDAQSCAYCRLCYRRDSPQCTDACRRCGIAMFSEDQVNVYPGSYPYSWNYPFAYPRHSPTSKSEGRLYYNYPRVTNSYYPSFFPFANYFGSLYRPILSFF